jgi:BirA family biotin operon repressor/biotin-[acetyl-CoA-carboxylase] ligase
MMVASPGQIPPAPREIPIGASEEELILAFLAEAGEEEFVSGEAICDKLGLSRAEVFRHVNSLRSQGYRIDALQAKGYKLVEVPDRLTQLELRPLINTRDIGSTLHCFGEVTSTNDVAKMLAEEGATHGEVVIAESQTHGRGRRGRSWISPHGRNLYCSVILRPDLPPSRAPELTLVAAVALCEVLQQAGAAAAIKWPNDVLVRGRKIAGLLTELQADTEKIGHVILGMGVNLNSPLEDFTPDVRAAATSLMLERGQHVPRALFTAACFTRLEEWLDTHEAKGFEEIRKAWRDLSETLGRDVFVRADGKEFAGVAEDIDPSGALMVRSGGRLERVLAADVELLRESEHAPHDDPESSGPGT